MRNLTFGPFEPRPFNEDGSPGKAFFLPSWLELL